MSEEQSVEREITVPVAPEEAWELVTERRHLERWLAPEVDIDLRDGGDVRVVGDDGVERTGTVELIDAPSRLRFTWEAEREDADDRRDQPVADRATALASASSSESRCGWTRSPANVVPLRPTPAAGPLLLAA